MSEPVSHLLDLFDALAGPDKQSALTELLRRKSRGATDMTDAGPAAPASLADLLAAISPDNLHGEWAAEWNPNRE